MFTIKPTRITELWVNGKRLSVREWDYDGYTMATVDVKGHPVSVSGHLPAVAIAAVLPLLRL